MKYSLGQRVQWTSSNTSKIGTIITIIPPGQRPAEIKNAGLPRTHESYVVRGTVNGGKGSANYWPLVSLLHPADVLTPDEIQWCHANADKIRDLMAKR